MIRCWINARETLSHGQIIEIRRGVNEHDGSIRVTRYYNHTNRSPHSFDEPLMSIPYTDYEPVIIGMVTDIESSSSRTSFNLRQIRDGLPVFNTEGRLLTKTFISSRITGLEDERAQSALGIYEADSQPIYWEGFPSESRPPQDVMIDRLDECHIYVGIFGVEYSEPTILEYRRAEELGRQRLCFVKDIDGRQQQLTTFLGEIRNDVVYQRFTSPSELKTLVREAVANAIEDLFE